MIVYSTTFNDVSRIVATNTRSVQNPQIEIECPQDTRCYDPSFSADGKRIVFATKSEEGYELVVWNSGNRSTDVVINFSAGIAQMIRSPSFSVDGNSIYFLEQETSNKSGQAALASNWGFYVTSLGVEENGSARNILTPPPSEAYAQTWQPLVSENSLISLKPDNYSDILISGYSSKTTAYLFGG